jgi:parallel beta-helix repeat protein
MDVSGISYIFSKRPAVYVALFFSLLAACGQEGGTGSGGMTSVGVTMTIPSGIAALTIPTGLQSQAPDQTGPVVTSVTLSVTAGAVPVLSSTTISVEPSQTVTINLEVPSGPARTFIAEAKDSNGLLLFHGQSSPVNLSPGVPTTVDVEMIQSNLIFVNAETGTDMPDCGTQTSPCNMVTQGLSQAMAGQTVMVAAGTYSFGQNSDHPLAEPVPLMMKSGVDIVGDTTNTVLDFSNANADGGTGIVGADNAMLSGFTIQSEEGSVTYLVDASNTALTITNNLFLDLNGDECCSTAILVGDTGTPSITGNTFGQGDLGLGTGIQVKGTADPFISGNTITNSFNGIVTTVSATAEITGNTITGNSVGVLIQDNSNPDLGGGAEGSLGGNTMSCNTSADLENDATKSISATNNFWDDAPPIEGNVPGNGIDIVRGDFEVDTTGAALAQSPCVFVTTTTIKPTTTTTPSSTTTTTTIPTTTTTTTISSTTTTSTTTRNSSTTTTIKPTTTTVATTTTTTRPATTTTSTTTTTVAIKLGYVEVVSIEAPDRITAGETRKVQVLVKNFSKTPQTRSLSLTLNGVAVSGNPVSVTLTKHDEVKVATFDVLFAKPGIATLRASLSPANVNRANDTKTKTVTVTSQGDDKD